MLSNCESSVSGRSDILKVEFSDGSVRHIHRSRLSSMDLDVVNNSQRVINSSQYDPVNRKNQELNRISGLVNVQKNVDREPPEDNIDIDLSEFEDLDKEGDLKNTKICGELGTDISLMFWYHKLVDPPKSYKQFLDYLSKHSQRPYPCLGQFTGRKAWEHKDGSLTILPEISTEQYNPADKFQSIRSSASRTAKQLTNLDWLKSSNENKKALVNLDLTFPSEVSEKLLGGIGDLKDRYWSVYKKFLELFNQTKGSYDLGNSANLHLWSSSEPLNPNSHFHSSIVWAKRIGDKVKPLDWSGPGKPADPDLIKSLWVQAIRSEFDIDPKWVGSYSDISADHSWLSNMVCEKVVVNLSWVPLSPKSWSAQKQDNPESYIKKKVIHRLKYCRRKPLTDLGEYFTKNEFSEDDVNVGFALDLIDYGNSSRQFGFWSRLTNCVNVQSSEGEPEKLCPVCGSEVEDVYRLEPGEYQPDKLVMIGKRGSVKSGKPPDNKRINLNTKPASPTIHQPEDLGGS